MDLKRKKVVMLRIPRLIQLAPKGPNMGKFQKLHKIIIEKQACVANGNIKISPLNPNVSEVVK